MFVSRLTHADGFLLLCQPNQQLRFPGVTQAPQAALLAQDTASSTSMAQREISRPAFAATRGTPAGRDEAREEEQVGSPPLPPFRFYFEEKLRAMAASQQAWMGNRRL